MMQNDRRELPEGWRWVRLGDVCDAIRGVNFRSGEGKPFPFEYSIACLTTSGVQDFTNWESRCFIPRHRLSSDIQLLRTGDLLVSTANSKALVGKSSEINTPPFECTFGAFVTVLRPRLEMVEPTFLSRWMRTPEVMKLCYERSSNTTNISNIRVSDLLSFEISLPPLSEQRRIAAILGEQMAAVEKARAALGQQLKTAKQLPSAYLREMFESAEAKQWRRVRLGDVCEVVSKGSTPTSYGHNFVNDGVPFLRAEDIQGGAINPGNVSFHVSEETHEFLGRSQLRSNDVLITIAGTLGRVGFVPEGITRLNCNQAVCFARPRPDTLYPPFVCFALRVPEIIAPFISLGVGGGVQNLSLVQVRDIQVPLPPLPKQRRIATVLAEQMAVVDKARIAMEEQKEVIDQISGASLRRAFNGEL